MARPYNIIAETRAKIKELQETKVSQLEEIAVKQTEAEAEANKAAQAAKDAAARMDLDAYEKAKAQESRARTACGMYSDKYQQIRKQEYISDAESEKVISDLLEHENSLAEAFKKAIAEHNNELIRLYTQYRAAVADAEAVIESWTTEIHANYLSDITTYANGTNRAPHPVPVHSVPYYGCPEADTVNNYLMRAYIGEE